MNITVISYDTIDSTNSEALRQARLGANEGLCVVARQQTAGRGRHGRTWVSPNDAGLYLSIVLRPKIETKFLPMITLAAGVAVHDLLVEIGLKPDIKWVNDILIADKKIAGILAETAETAIGLAVVVGVGINIRSSNFPVEIAATATSIEIESVSTPPPDSTDLTAAFIRYFGYFYEMLRSGNGSDKILQEWRRRSTYYSGKNVRVILENESITGVTDGLEENGALRVRTDNGMVRVVQAGDVENLRQVS